MIATLDDRLIVIVPKGPARYVIVFEERNYYAALAAVLRWVIEPELAFTFADSVRAGAEIHKHKPMSLIAAEQELDWLENQ